MSLQGLIYHGDPRLPTEWQHETSGQLRPAVLAYLNKQRMEAHDFAAIRGYLLHYVQAPCWKKAGQAEHWQELEHGILSLKSRSALDDWLDEAAEIGLDPL